MRIVVFGATGYTGRLVAERLVAQGARPVLAGRDDARLSELASALGGLETARADAMRQNSVFDLVESGDVLVSTGGPFVKGGLTAARAAIAAGATYLDSTGEAAVLPPVVPDLTAPARPSGAALLTARGSDVAPGSLAGALAAGEAGEAAARVAIGRYALGATASSMSAGTRESMIGATLSEAFAYRDGRIKPVRTVERVRSFNVSG